MSSIWVTPDDFDADKLSILALPTSGTYERSKLLYSYDSAGEVMLGSMNGPMPGLCPEERKGSANGLDVQRDLILTVPRTPEAFVVCRGVKKDMFSQGDVKVETNRYGAQLILKADNEYHLSLYKAFEKVVAKVQELTGSSVTFPVKDMEGYSIIYTNLIHANDGRMFSTAYTAEEKVDILDVRQSIVRPALLLSLLRKSPTEVKIRVQISQMYIHEEVKNFPLATID